MPVSLILVKSGWENTQVSVKFGQQQYQPLIKFLPLCLCVCICVFLTKCESFKNPPPNTRPSVATQCWLLLHFTWGESGPARLCACPVSKRRPVEQNSRSWYRNPRLLWNQKSHYLADRYIYFTSPLASVIHSTPS